MMRRAVLAAAFFAATTGVALALTIPPSDIVKEAYNYDGSTLTVAGTVKNFQTSSTPMGTVAGFQLCDSQCIVVIDQTDTPRTNGSKATVTGKFYTTFKGPRKTYTNALVIAK